MERESYRGRAAKQRKSIVVPILHVVDGGLERVVFARIEVRGVVRREHNEFLLPVDLRYKRVESVVIVVQMWKACSAAGIEKSFYFIREKPVLGHETARFPIRARVADARRHVTINLGQITLYVHILHVNTRVFGSRLQHLFC